MCWATINYTAKACRFGPYPTDPVRAPSGRAAVCTAPQPQRTAAAAHRMLVILGDFHRDLRDLMLLVAVHHPQVRGIGQIVSALAKTLRESILLVIGLVQPGEVRARRSGLLAFGPLRPTTPLLHRRRRPARITVHGRRHRGVARVAREQVLNPGQPRGELGVHRPQRSDLLGLLTDEREQLLTRHRLGLKHPKIKLRSGPPPP
jgi:hypothetical protein